MPRGAKLYHYEAVIPGRSKERLIRFCMLRNLFSKLRPMSGTKDHGVPLEVDCRTVRQRRQEEQLLLLDCREPDEYARVHIDGSLLIPMNEVPTRQGELEPYRSQPIVVYCHHGGRSLRVTHWLRGQGFTLVQNMAGGIDAWSLEIDPSLPRY